MELSTEGISVWFFTHSEVPSDLLTTHPNPNLWKKTKHAHFPSTNCNTSKHFRSQRIVINNTFCGGYAGYSFLDDKCPNTRVGSSQMENCIEFVRNHPDSFK